MKANSLASKVRTFVGRKSGALALLCAVSWLGVATVQAQTRAFEATDIGVVTALGGLSNDFPVRVVGQHISNGVAKAFEFNESTLFKRTLPPAIGDSANTVTIARDVSPNGAEAVGTSGAIATDWPNPGGISNPGHFPMPPANCLGGSDAFGINNNRVAVGFCTSVNDGTTLVPTRWSVTTQFNVAMLPVGVIAGTNIPQSAKALDINDNGIIVGQQGSLPAVWTNPTQQPFVLNVPNGQARGLSNGSVLNGNPDLFTVTGDLSIGYSASRGLTFLLVNGGASFVSYTRIPFVCIYNPQFACNDPVQYLLQQFNGVSTRKINRNGFTVGSLIPRNGGATAAAIWSMSGLVATLAANTSNLPTNTILTEAVDINDSNFILAQGMVNGQLHGFLLRPTGATINFQVGY